MSQALFTSPTYGQLTLEQVVAAMRNFYDKNNGNFSVVIGTDSQNFSDTKMVTVIAMCCEGHGGIYFYKIERIDKIQDVRTKLNFETQLSLQYADALLGVLADTDEELFNNINFSIHVDAGNSNKGKTKDLIPSLVGWIHACGYECHVKPDSFAASAIANKISK